MHHLPNDIFVRDVWFSRHPEILERVLCICEQLEDILCVVKFSKDKWS